MKLIAVFQILILLISVIIPEGAHQIMRGCSCGDDCQCSSEIKQAGTCCCSEPSSEAADTKKSGCCQPKISTCCSKPKKQIQDRPPACCQKSDSAKACCSPQNSDTNSASSRDSVMAPSCGCQEVVIHLTVVLMPRLKPSTLFLNDPLLAVDRLTTVSDSILANSLLPEVPPPKNCLSVTTTNSFAA